MDSFKQRKHLPLQGRPRMLKDFLLDDLNSCSPSRFKSFPRREPDDPIIPNLNSGNSRLQRSRSKAAATTMSAFQAVINAVKNIHFAAVKSHLPRSLSRRLSRRNLDDRNGDNKENDVEIRTITIKDIMRWKSFRDLVDEKHRPVDFASSPQHCTTATATTTTTGSTNTPCISSGSSWCESDFTSEYSPEECGEKYSPCVGKDLLMEPTTATAAAESEVGPKGELDYEDEEQQSPVSVLGFQYEEDEESISSFNQSLANMERTKQNLMQRIQRLECLAKLDPTNLEQWMSMEETSSSEAEEEEEEEEEYEMEEADEVEEKAKQLLNHVKATHSSGTSKNSIAILLLDLFREELGRNNKYDHHGRDDEGMIRVAKAWMDGEHGGVVDWGAEDKREIFVRDMDGGLRWSKFEDEEEEDVAFEVECGLMNHLLDELLGDLSFSCFLPIQIGMTHA